MTAESRSRDQKPFVVIAVAHATKREGFRGVFLHFSLDIKQRSVRYSRAMKLSSARARKLAGMRKTHGAGSGRPRSLHLCPRVTPRPASPATAKPKTAFLGAALGSSAGSCGCRRATGRGDRAPGSPLRRGRQARYEMQQIGRAHVEL